jgi:hypothetical protein
MMKPRTAAEISHERGETTLDGRYGKIGIPAVAAAIAYQSDSKSAADAPAASRTEQWLAQLAAA